MIIDPRRLSSHLMHPEILDGQALARTREPLLAARAEAVLRSRGRSPRLFLVAFAESGGEARHLSGKRRACARVGIELRIGVTGPETETAQACDLVRNGLLNHRPDAVFLQSPFPPAIDEEALTSIVPPDQDIDVLSALAYRGYMGRPSTSPPLTVRATLELLEENDRIIADRKAVVVGPDTPFNRMFAKALRRRGAATSSIDPGSPDRSEYLAEADLVVVSVARPGVISSHELPRGCVAVDAGYFNVGGLGDIDTSSGIDHLAALVPVPGGVGPMTVSVLLEAVIERCVRTEPAASAG